MERSSQCLLYLARVSQAGGKTREAAQLMAVAQRMIEAQMQQRIYERNFTPHYRHSMQVLLEGMTPEDYDAGLADAQAMPVEQAVVVALHL